MPTIQLTDKLGLDLKVTPDPAAAISKYLKAPTFDFAPVVQLADIGHLGLDQAPLKQFSTGLVFPHSSDWGSGQTEFSIAAGVNGEITVHQAGSTVLAEHYRAPIEAQPGEAYLGFGLKATLSPAISSQLNNLSFGIQPGTEIAFRNWQRFATQPTAPTLVEAIATAVRNFSIPGDIEDLIGMQVGAVATVEGKGDLQFSAEADLSQSTSLFAGPAALKDIAPVKVKAGGSLSTAASFRVTGEYQVRVRKIDGNTVELGYFKKAEADFEISASASYGVSVTLGKTDIIPTLLRLVSSDPAADEKALAAAGLSDDRVADIQNAVKAGVDRALAAAVNYEFNALDAAQAAFLYEIRLDQLTAEGREAVHCGLDGDLARLAKLAGGGITTVRSILDNIQNRTHTFKVNLIGVFNYASISELLRDGEVLFDPAQGGLVITDRATANRIRAAMVNFAADPDKLRGVLSEHFLITAAYRAIQVGDGPELSSTHTYFEYHRKTNRQTMKDNLDALQAVGMIRASEKLALLGPVDEFGNCSLALNAEYDNEICTRLFLDADENPRPMAEFEKVGRQALASLIDSSDADGYRLRPLTDDHLWTAMRGAGSAPAIRGVLPPDLSGDEVKWNVVVSDYVLIVWWADTMSSTAKALNKVRAYQAQHPALDPQNNEFIKLRKQLADHLADVARKTKEQFSDPWGLVAMDLAGGRRADLTARLCSPKLSLAQRRPKAVPAGAVG